MNTFEIVAFEHGIPYDEKGTTTENAVKEYVAFCKKWLSPEYVPHAETHTSHGNMYFSYSDQTSDDKPMLLMLIGPLTGAMVIEIKRELEKLYEKHCEACDGLVDNHAFAWCKECREKERQQHLDRIEKH
jgi:hypothetical protein